MRRLQPVTFDGDVNGLPCRPADWISRELEAGLSVSAMLAIGHSPTPVMHCPQLLYDMLKLVNACFTNKNSNEIYRCVPVQHYRISSERSNVDLRPIKSSFANVPLDGETLSSLITETSKGALPSFTTRQCNT